MLHPTGYSPRLDHQLTIVNNYTLVNSITEHCFLGKRNIDQHLILSTNFDRSYEKACTRLRLLYSVRKYLSTKSSESNYELIILPLLTCSSTIKTTLLSYSILEAQFVGATCSKGILPEEYKTGC